MKALPAALRHSKGDDAPGASERHLWCAVITQAIEDATSTRTSTEALRDKREARAWLLGRSVNFVQACSLAGVDPDAVREYAVGLFEQAGVVGMFEQIAPDQSFPSAQDTTKLEFSAP